LRVGTGDGAGRLFIAQMMLKRFDTHLSGAHFQQATDDDADHAGKESVGADLKMQAFAVFTYLQMRGTDAANGVLKLVWRSAKRVVVVVLRQQIHRSLHA